MFDNYRNVRQKTENDRTVHYNDKNGLFRPIV